MPIVDNTKNNKLYAVEVSAEATDLLNGANIPYAALTTPSGFPSIVKAYQGPGGWVNKFAPEEFIYARDTGRLWQIQLDDQVTPTQALVLIAEGSAQPSAGSQGPDIVYVTAQPAKYPGMSGAVYTTLIAAILALNALPGSRTAILLDDTYDLLAASLQVNNLINIVALSRAGVTITSANPVATLLTGGNHFFKGLTVTNTGGGKAIVPTAGGTITLDGCPVIEDVDASVNNTNTGVVTLNKTQLDDFLCGAAQCSLENYSNSLVNNITMPTLGSIVQSVGASITTANVNGTLYTEQGEISDVGTTIPPVDFQAIGTRFANSATVSAQVLRLQGTNNDSIAAFSSTVGDITCDDCVFLGTSSLTSAANLSFSGGKAPALVAASGTVTSISAELLDIISAASVDLTTVKTRASGGATITGTASVVVRNSTIGKNLVTGAAGSINCVDTEVTAAPSLGAGASFTLQGGSLHLGAAGAGNGAIINNGGIVTLIDTYVRADDTFYSVSGTGTVNTQGYIGGGCRFNTSGGLVVGTTTSDVRANAVFSANPINANSTLDALSGGTNEVFDMFLLSGIVASGFVVNIYPARDFPLGFELVVKNVDTTNSVDIAPALSGSIDGSSTPITLAPNDFRRMRKISLTGWTTC